MELQWDLINPLPQVRLARALRGVYAVEEFRTFLEYERARVDRYGSEFSLLVFDLNQSRDKFLLSGRLAWVLNRRMRLTDMIGWYAKNRLGVFLPGTPAAGAWKLAHDISQLIDLPLETLNCTVYSYPIEEYQDAIA